MGKRSAAAAIGALFFGGLSLIAILIFSGDQLDSKSLLLPVLAISSVCLLLGALAVVALSFAAFGLTDRTQALALPEGSIRAVIALSLIVLFTILAVYLYHGTTKGSLESVKGVTADQRAAVVTELQHVGRYIAAVQEGDTFRIYFRSGPSLESTDLAKQLLILLGTLVTSVSSFYFGSRAASPLSVVSPDTLSGDPKLLTSSPAAAAIGASPVVLTLTGQNLGALSEVLLASGTAALHATAKQPTPSGLKATFDVAGATPGTWDVVVVDSEGKRSTLPSVLMLN